MSKHMSAIVKSGLKISACRMITLLTISIGVRDLEATVAACLVLQRIFFRV